MPIFLNFVVFSAQIATIQLHAIPYYSTPKWCKNGVWKIGLQARKRHTTTAPKNWAKALMIHTTIGITAQRICRWLFHFLLHFGANMEKNIASTSLGFPAYLATPPCDNGISCANKGWNLTFAELCLNSKALSETICRILQFISYNLWIDIFSIEFQS